MSLAAFAKQAAKACSSNFARTYSASAGDGFKVGVLGAAGGIGQPLSLLMKVRSGAIPYNLPLTRVCCPVVGRNGS